MKKQPAEVLKAKLIVGIYHSKLYLFLAKKLEYIEQQLPDCFERTGFAPSDKARFGASGAGDFYISLKSGFDMGELNHEISHAVDNIFDYIGEKAPGDECRAYLNQYITDFCHKQIKKWSEGK